MTTDIDKLAQQMREAAEQAREAEASLEGLVGTSHWAATERRVHEFSRLATPSAVLALLDDRERLREALRAERLELIAAWEALPGGRNQSVRAVERWLMDDMAPVINARRRAIVEAVTPPTVVDEIAAERQRQVAKGWTAEHADDHDSGDMKLVERLRAHRPYNESPHGDGVLVREAASAIERLVRERDAAKGTADDVYRKLIPRAEAAEADRDRLAKLVAEMRDALKPFSAIAEEYSDSEGDDFQVWKDFDVLGATLPLRIFRRARALLQRT